MFIKNGFCDYSKVIALFLHQTTTHAIQIHQKYSVY